MPKSNQAMDEAVAEQVAPALGKIPSGLYILTAAFEDRRTGMLASWVQQASFHPPMVSVAVNKGRAIMPLISDSHQFALCQIPKDDKVLLRKFASGIDPEEDPFLGFELVEGITNSPVMRNCMAYMECELACHMDYEGDHDLFIGRIINGAYFDGDPFVHIRPDGFKY